MTARLLSDAALDRLRQVAGEVPEEAGPEGELLAGRYRLIELLDRGGMGEVYRAEDRELGREVAVKVLAPLAESDAGDAASVPAAADLERRMRTEARVLARLEHPGIVPVHDVGRLPDGRLFYAMRRVDGPRLDAHVASGLPPAERLRIFERICEAVAFAHSRGVIHRDLKPENVMVGPFGEVLVLDWGLAKLRTAEAPISQEEMLYGAGAAAVEPLGRHPSTRHGTVLGTPGYMAPEQARGEAAAVDERADVHALGAVLEFLLTSGAPDREPPPPPLLAIARKARAAAPENRYPNVESLAADVAAYRAGDAVSAYRESLLERLGRFVRRYKTPIFLVLAYLVMRVLLWWWRGY